MFIKRSLNLSFRGDSQLFPDTEILKIDSVENFQTCSKYLRRKWFCTVVKSGFVPLPKMLYLFRWKYKEYSAVYILRIIQFCVFLMYTKYSHFVTIFIDFYRFFTWLRMLLTRPHCILGTSSLNFWILQRILQRFQKKS